MTWRDGLVNIGVMTWRDGLVNIGVMTRDQGPGTRDHGTWAIRLAAHAPSASRRD